MCYISVTIVQSTHLVNVILEGATRYERLNYDNLLSLKPEVYHLYFMEVGVLSGERGWKGLIQYLHGRVTCN